VQLHTREWLEGTELKSTPSSKVLQHESASEQQNLLLPPRRCVHADPIAGVGDAMPHQMAVTVPWGLRSRPRAKDDVPRPQLQPALRFGMALTKEEALVQQQALAFAKANRRGIARRLTDPQAEEHPVSVFMAGFPGERMLKTG
jgi:hypothetical protein